MVVDGTSVVSNRGEVVTSVNIVDVSAAIVVWDAVETVVGDWEIPVLRLARTVLVVTAKHSGCDTIRSLIKVTAPLIA